MNYTEPDTETCIKGQRIKRLLSIKRPVCIVFTCIERSADKTKNSRSSNIYYLFIWQNQCQHIGRTHKKGIFQCSSTLCMTLTSYSLNACPWWLEKRGKICLLCMVVLRVQMSSQHRKSSYFLELLGQILCANITQIICQS